MSVEQKIKQLLGRASESKEINEEQEVVSADGTVTVSTTKDTSKAGTAANAGDGTTRPRQGNSKDADTEEVLDATGKNTAAAKMSKESNPLPMKGDAKSVKTQANEESEEDADWIILEQDEDNTTAKVAGHKVTLHRSQREDGTSDTYTLHHPSGDKKVKISFDKHGDGSEVHGDKVNHAFGLDSKHKLGHKIADSMNGMGGISKFEESVDIKGQLMAIFGDDLSEQFRTKATSIFEAAVIARVNNEMEKVSSKLEEQMVEQLQEYKETLVEKVDTYLNYVVEQWLEENKVAIEAGLRTEIAEDFISGLKTLFTEHYIEVPEDKYDVMEELQVKTAELTEELNSVISTNIEISKELSEIKRTRIFEEQTKDLASTEVEKLKKLVEGIDLDSEDLYREKVSVIKENYFPKGVKASPEQVLIEDSATNSGVLFESDSAVDRYAQAIARSVKSR